MTQEFEKWAKRMGYAEEDDVSHMRHAAREGWQARQPEIDALKESLSLCDLALDSRDENISTLRKEYATLKTENERLRLALKGLLSDTQHAEHEDCEDGPCPVREAREILRESK